MFDDQGMVRLGVGGKRSDDVGDKHLHGVEIRVDMDLGVVVDLERDEEIPFGELGLEFQIKPSLLGAAPPAAPKPT